MDQLVIYTVLLPLLGFLFLAFSGRKISSVVASITGCGTIGISAVLMIIAGILFISSGEKQIEIMLWQWFSVKDLNVGISFLIDPLSLTFSFIITWVGFLIHLYSAEYMKDDEGVSRFFAYMNLFVASMLILVLAGNLVLLYLGWEGVGLCSFLLIGFWYGEPQNATAARKAFIVTRIGDTAFAIGLFLLFLNFNTLSITGIFANAHTILTGNTTLATAIALLLLGGATGKSAQLPLQTWLPDAMAGPTPVSALIHAATMVTAGVYLIARLHVIFAFSPVAMTITAVIGAATLLIAGVSALYQTDIKKALAYSTISQIGYMFLGLGVGAWSAAIFHFMTHAFFKALLFLAAGSVIMALNHEQNMFKMGGLVKKLPVTFITFLAGAASLAALPLITAGFYSKDQIMWFAFSSPGGSIYLWAAALTGALITAVYSTRMVLITFLGDGKTDIHHLPGKFIKIPLITLAFFSIVAGFIELPENMGNIHFFSGFLSSFLPETEVTNQNFLSETTVQMITGILVLAGILVTFLVYAAKRKKDEIRESNRLFNRFFRYGWGFDSLYTFLFIRPFLFLSAFNKNDFFDRFYSGIAMVNIWFNRILSFTQNGNTRWYIMGIAGGAALILLTILTI